MAILEVTSSYPMTISDSVVHVCSGSGSNPTGGQTADITITLPKASEAKGRVYRVVKANSSNYQVIIDSNGSELIDGSTNNLIITALEQFKGINLTSYLDGSTWKWQSSNAASNYLEVTSAPTITYSTVNKRFEVGGVKANIIHVTSSSSDITITLPAATTAMYTDKAKLRIVHINNTGSDGIARTVTVTGYPALSVGQSINLFVNSSNAWEKAGPVEITASGTTVNLGVSHTDKFTFLVSGTSNQTITLPTVADRFGSSTKPPSVTISSSMQSNTVTINRAGSDVIYDEGNTVTGSTVTSITLNTDRPSVTFTSLGNGVWKTDKTSVSLIANTTQTGTSGTYSKVTTSNASCKLPFTVLASASFNILVSTGDNAGYIIKNVHSTNTITISRPSGGAAITTLVPGAIVSIFHNGSDYIAKPAHLSIDITSTHTTSTAVTRNTNGLSVSTKIFTSTGFTTSISVPNGATKIFVYSPGIDAWAVI